MLFLATIAILITATISSPASHFPHVVGGEVEISEKSPSTGEFPPPLRVDAATHIGHILLNHVNDKSDFSALAWEPFKPGVTMVPLYGNFTAGPSAKLLRYEPGAKVGLHQHLGWEHIFILKGSQTDISGKHMAGDIVFNSPGSCHRLESEEGCLLLAIYEKPVKFDLAPNDCPEADRIS